MSIRELEEDNCIRRKGIHDVGQMAAIPGAVLHYAFERNSDGSPSEEVARLKGLFMFLTVLLVG
jgi:hypothetical protein